MSKQLVRHEELNFLEDKFQSGCKRSSRQICIGIMDRDNEEFVIIHVALFYLRLLYLFTNQANFDEQQAMERVGNLFDIWN